MRQHRLGLALVHLQAVLDHLVIGIVEPVFLQCPPAQTLHTAAFYDYPGLELPRYETIAALSLQLTGRAVLDLATDGLSVAPNEAMCAYWVERSAALATALAPQIGYARAAEISKQSVKENVLIRDLVKREKVIPADEIDEVLDLRKMTEIGVPGGAHGGVSAG